MATKPCSTEYHSLFSAAAAKAGSYEAASTIPRSSLSALGTEHAAVCAASTACASAQRGRNHQLTHGLGGWSHCSSKRWLHL